MANLINQERVHIDKFPVVDKEQLLKKDIEITIGDLHGNAVKLLFLLIKHGIATGITAEDYQNFVKLYKKDSKKFTQEDLQDFNHFLNKIQFQSEGLIRLIGDELADRGQNDYFTLRIFQKLRQNHVPFEVLISNHGVELVEAYETKDNFNPPRLAYVHSQSAYHLQQWIESGLITRQEVIELIEEAYKPALKAISYSLTEDKAHITIYSHAGIGLNTIEEIAQKLGVPYKDKTAVELGNTIDVINIKFQEYVKNNLVHTLYDAQVMQSGYEGNSLKGHPFEFLMWNRTYHSIQRPARKYHYGLSYAHGHDQEIQSLLHIINLDNNLGKSIDHYPDIYNVLYTNKMNVPLPKPDHSFILMMLMSPIVKYAALVVCIASLSLLSVGIIPLALGITGALIGAGLFAASFIQAKKLEEASPTMKL